MTEIMNAARAKEITKLYRSDPLDKCMDAINFAAMQGKSFATVTLSIEEMESVFLLLDELDYNFDITHEYPLHSDVLICW